MKKNRHFTNKQEKLRCPVCRECITHISNPRNRHEPMHSPLRSRPGDLTECDRCSSVLEYGGSFDALTISLAPRHRTECFKKAMAKDYYWRPTIPQLIEYVRANHRMPEFDRRGQQHRLPSINRAT